MKEIQPDTAELENLWKKEEHESGAAEISELIRCDMLRYPRKLDAGDDAYEK